MSQKELTDVETHFSFGENWESFAKDVTEQEIELSRVSLSRLISEEEMKGKSFLDIGCGSGLSMLAALKLGASSVYGVDIDPNSCNAAKGLLTKYAADSQVEVHNVSIFEEDSFPDRKFDFVHSWGVLHHTGDMWRAIDRALDILSEDGCLVIALYRKTPVCGFWKWEKRFYTSLPRFGQFLLSLMFRCAYLMAIMLTGRNPIKYIREYPKERGMDWSHDVHDWLGGYPYESVTPEELEAYVNNKGYFLVKTNCKPPVAKGIFGTHCDEFVIRRK